MAPVAPLGRDRAIQLVKQGQLPLWFGSPHPTVAVVEQDGVYRVRQLVIDPAEARAASERAIANREPWMPEHHYALGKPTGTIYAEGRTRAELIEQMRTMTWPASW
jgi:hypothetical protein